MSRISRKTPQLPIRWKDEIPEGCQRGATPDRVALLRVLLDLWLRGGEAGEFRTQKALCEKLRIIPQDLSNWKANAPGKKPEFCPWWLLLRLAFEVDVVIVIDPEKGAQIYNKKKEDALVS